MKLKDKVALITGGAQGIGFEIAKVFYEEGAIVVLADVNEELAKSSAASLDSTGKRATGIRLNVVSAEEAGRAAQDIAQKFGHIHILVNNAGITRDGLLMRMKDEDWALVLQVNLTGTFNCTKAVLPLMVKNRAGKIISIASIVGAMGNAGQANYAATKAGVIGFTKSVAREVASRNIQVNAIAPGFIDTEMTRKLSDDVRQKLSEQIPMGRLGSPEDVAKAALFLASSDADYVTGHVLHVNGGMLMN